MIWDRNPPGSGESAAPTSYTHMSSTVTGPRVAPDPRDIRANNDEVDRLVGQFETPIDRFVRHHRGKLHLLAFLLALAWATPCLPQVLLALPLITLGLAIRAWCSGYLAKNTELCTTGPYAYCRHPMYLANFIIVAGILLAGNNVYMTATGLVLTILVQVFAIRREEALLHYLFGEDYARYCRHTPCVLPWPPRSAAVQGSGQFTWLLARYNGIGEQAAGVLLLLILFAVKALVLAHYGHVYPVTYGLWPPPLG